MEPLGRHAIHRPLGAAAEFFSRSRARRVIDHEFGEIDRTAGTGVDCVGDLAKILGVGNLVVMPACSLQRVVSRARQRQAALLGRMAQHDPAVFGVTGSVMEHPACKDPRLARIVRISKDARFVGFHLRRDHNGGRRQGCQRRTHEAQHRRDPASDPLQPVPYPAGLGARGRRRCAGEGPHRAGV